MRTAIILALVLASGSAAARENAPPPRSGESSDSNEPNPKSKIVWLDAEGGIETTNLNTFTENFDAFSVGFLPRSGTGPVAGAGAGFRIVFVTLGVRGRIASFTDDSPSRTVNSWTMSSIDGEVGFRAPLGRAEPYLTLASGYTTLGGFSSAVSGLSSGLSANGFDARLGLGFDYFVSRWLSVGANGTAEVVALTRPGVPVKEVAALTQTQTLDVAAIRLLEANGSTYGSAFALTGGVKAHF